MSDPVEATDPDVVAEDATAGDLGRLPRSIKRRLPLSDGDQQDHFDRQLVKRPWQRGW